MFDLGPHHNDDQYRVCLLSSDLDLGSFVWSRRFGVGTIIGGTLWARNVRLILQFHPPGDLRHRGTAGGFLCRECAELAVERCGRIAPEFLRQVGCFQ